MIQKDKPRFSQIMLGMADNFRDTVTKEGLNMRFDMLSGFSLEEVESAAKKILRHRKYTKMPPIAEFIEAMEGSKTGKALNAWGLIVKSLEQGQGPPTDAKMQEAIKRVGGWDWISRQTYEELHWLEKRFVEHYEAITETDAPLLTDGEAAKVLDMVERRRKVKWLTI